MLGRYSNGMTINIPAQFRDSNKNPVAMENVNVGIQFFDKGHRNLKQILDDTPMKSIGDGKYVYEFTIPPYAESGNYIVHIHAKHPGSISNVSEATDTFEVIEENKPVVTAEVEKTKSNFDINTFKIDQVKQVNPYERIDVEDIVVDVFNKPIKGVHINVFEKNGFMPKNPNNVKINSTVSDENGSWKMRMSPGEYVFTFKSLGHREIREFRKV